MPRLFVGNFDFESSLAAGQSTQSLSSLRRIVAELATVWVATAEMGDVLWCPEPIDPRFFEQLQQHGLTGVRPVTQAAEVPPGLELVPWGWTEEVVRWGQAVGAIVDAPPLESVRLANSRRLSHQWEQDRGIGLPGAAIAESVIELFETVDRLSPPGTGWVVKAEFSNSSRERFLHRADRPLDRGVLTRWAERRFATGQALYVEPWVERVDEIGVQLTVPRTGEPHVEGVTRLLTDTVGHYEGNVFAPTLDDEPHWQDAVATAREVARALQQIGYFGPLGIDAVRYRDAAGNIHLRPIQDINARWTMGRLSLGLRRLLRSGECGTWCHGDTCDDLAGTDSSPSAAARIVPTSPLLVGGRPVQRRSRVVISTGEPG